MATLEPAIENIQQQIRDLATPGQGFGEQPPTREQVQAAGAKLRDNIASLIGDIQRLYDSAILVTGELSSPTLAADCWKDLYQRFWTLLGILERIPKHQIVLLNPESDRLLEQSIRDTNRLLGKSITVVRSILVRAEHEYQSYSETAYLLGSKANAERLREAIEEADSGTLPVYESAGDFFKSLRGK
jgi:hypothetical protein